MSNYGKKKKQEVEETDDNDFFEGMSDETRELFRRAAFKVVDEELRQIEEEMKDVVMPPPSKRYKIRMNRLFRERVRGSFLPFPEEDNLYERVRSKLVIKIKINEVLDRRKRRRQEKIR